MSGEQVGKTADGFRRHSFNTRIARAQRRAEAEARAVAYLDLYIERATRMEEFTDSPLIDALKDPE